MRAHGSPQESMAHPGCIQLRVCSRSPTPGADLFPPAFSWPSPRGPSTFPAPSKSKYFATKVSLAVQPFILLLPPELLRHDSLLVLFQWPLVYLYRAIHTPLFQLSLSDSSAMLTWFLATVLPPGHSFRTIWMDSKDMNTSYMQDTAKHKGTAMVQVANTQLTLSTFPFVPSNEQDPGMQGASTLPCACLDPCKALVCLGEMSG